ncbi:MAG: hypothetical protein FJ145_07195 [Deltaproteobacteria bacterium]|nr:hypothetical protein [Deltaproteobacteria bacterium]
MRIRLLSTLVACLMVLAAHVAHADDITITKEALQKQLGKADVVVVDVRTGKDWGASEHKISKAVRVPQENVATLTKKHKKETTFVFYCA